MATYSQDIKPRLKLLERHSKKPCLHGQCNTESLDLLGYRRGARCERHLDSSAIVRRYLRMHKSKPLTEKRIKQSLGTYNHADRTEWRRRFPI